MNRKSGYQHGQGVLIYLARCIRGGPIKNRRLLSMDKDTVTFRVSRRHEELNTLILKIDEFLMRILEHVPTPGFRVVRSYSLYHHAHREKLEACREQLGGGAVPEEEAGQPSSKQSDDEEETAVFEPETCSVCGTPLQLKEPLSRAPPPPELKCLWEQAP